ncbi:MAG: hypothetical protein RL685_3661 [Pseudomonadota bacterium]|jgi:hypothetical protein
MNRHRSADPPGAASYSETWPPTTLTERLLDVLLDTRGVCAAFIVNDFGELLSVRFAPAGPPRSAFAGALEAAAGLRIAASSGLEPATVVVEFPLGFLFARRFRRSYLCVWSKEALPPKAMDMSSRLVAASLPPDARMEAASAPQWDEDDQRPTEPWLPDGDWSGPGLTGALEESLEISLRAPAVPRELIDTERDVRAVRQLPKTAAASGIRSVATLHQPAARARQRR